MIVDWIKLDGIQRGFLRTWQLSFRFCESGEFDDQHCHLLYKKECEQLSKQLYSGLFCEPGSLVCIATDYGLDDPASNSGRDEIYPAVQTDPGAHPASCKMGTGSFPGVKCGRGVLLTTHPLLVPRSWKSRALPLPTLWATPGL